MPRKWSSIAWTSIALLAAPAFCAVKVGDPAPPIALDALLPSQPVENASLNAMAGKVVVLEFWATWCGPCVDAIPHLNELADRYAGRPIQFLSVTDEDSAVVEKFLKARPIHGWVGYDRGKRMSIAYGFDGIPDTVLIDASGKVAGIAHPSMLKAEHLEDLLAGKPVKLPAFGGPDLSIPRTATEGGPAPMLDILVRPSSSNNAGMRSGGGKFEVRAFPLRLILANAYGMDSAFVVGDAVDDETRYDVSIAAPRTQDRALRKMLPDLLAVAFQITAEREKRESDGWVLKAPHGKPDVLKETASTGGSANWGGGKVHITGSGSGQLAKAVQSLIGKPVADQTGIEGRFDIDLKYDTSRPDSLLDVLRESGFVLEPAKLPIEYLVVTKASSTRAVGR